MQGLLSKSKENVQLLMFSISETKQAQLVGSAGHTLGFIDQGMYYFRSHLYADVKIV